MQTRDMYLYSLRQLTRNSMAKKPVEKARVEFRTSKSSEPVLSMELSGALSELHRSPEKLRKLMESLDLPKGTTATVTVQATSTIVR